jgi:hypothetical protein
MALTAWNRDRISRAFALMRTSKGRRQLGDYTLTHIGRVLRTRLGTVPEPNEQLEQITSLPNLVTRSAVRVFVTLGLPDLIAEGVFRPEELADRVGANQDALRRLAHHLEERGVLTMPNRDELRLTEIGLLLCTDHPGGRNVSFQIGASSSRLEAAIGALMHSIQTGGPAYAAVHGAELWEQIAAEPLLATSFDLDMAVHARRIAPAFVERYDWSGISQVADVGGGSGRYLREILEQQPHVRGVLIEFADAAVQAQEEMEAAGLANRCTVVQSSFFEELPPGSDAYILSWILHDWDDAHAKTILERCSSAAGNRGRVLVIERTLDVEGDSDLDLRMLVYCGGRERTRRELEQLAEGAGMRTTRWIELISGFSVLECRRA